MPSRSCSYLLQTFRALDFSSKDRLPAQIKGAGHWLRIDVTDNGEPGDQDVFNIVLDTGYKAGGKLGGGNVTVH
jgi:hypothetical protein